MRATLGDVETDILRYVADNGEMTVGEAADGYGGPSGLSRSTVVTMLERLRKKGHLSRRKADDGVYRYFSAAPSDEVMGGLIQRFVDRTLSGSMTPLVAYFANRRHLTDEEVAQLTRLLGTDEAMDAPKTNSEEAK